MSEHALSRTTPKDFFLYLGATAALYVSVISLLRLLFEVINTLYPDVLRGPVGFSSDSLRLAVASLIVIFPLYLLLARIAYRGERKEPSKRMMAVRRWLTYLTIFVGGITLAVDLIVLINAFLGGELTTRFILKVLAVFVVIGAAFAFYLKDLREDLANNPRKLKSFALIASAAVLASIACGFLVIGSPMTARKERLDQQRVSDLENLQSHVVNYWQRKGTLPATFDDLEDPLSGSYIPLDPATGEPYAYRPTGELSFELCAVFSSAGDGRDMYGYYPSRPYPAGLEGKSLAPDTWEHEAGRGCFERTIDPELYPPITNNAVPIKPAQM